MFVLFCAVAGAILASFVNVLASRGPRRWALTKADGKPTGLAFPPSQCEACSRKLSVAELIPVLSYLLLRGRCRTCESPIGMRHLIVEVIGFVLGVLVAIRFGPSAEVILASVLLLFLLTLAIIDAETGFLPDALTLPLIGLGLLASLFPGQIGLLPALLGAAIGGGGLWLLSFAYRHVRGREGLGGGDVKLVAAAGAWCGGMALPFVLLASSLGGLLYALVAMSRGAKERALTAELRFGPFLAVAIATVYLAGPALIPG